MLALSQLGAHVLLTKAARLHRGTIPVVTAVVGARVRVCDRGVHRCAQMVYSDVTQLACGHHVTT